MEIIHPAITITSAHRNIVFQTQCAASSFLSTRSFPAAIRIFNVLKIKKGGLLSVSYPQWEREIEGPHQTGSVTAMK